jgi:Ser/Thr protein kinase RdoA (MazF antagonist)
MSEDHDSAASGLLPEVADWARLGLRAGVELHAGHQSRVIRASGNGQELVVKLTDRRFVDEAFFGRLELLDDLADVDPHAVGAVRFGDSLAVAVGRWWIAAYPFVPGRTPVITQHDDVAAMASTLASLHRSLRKLDAPRVPTVAALRRLESPPPGSGPYQLLHGDFSAANVLLTDGGVRVTDFDDAGYGPIEFDVGNTLYMALFDATMAGTLDVYESYRRWFVTAYDGAAGTALDPQQLDAAITLRRAALRSWLDDLTSAPIGIRTATPQWHQYLRRFADAGNADAD